MKKGTKKGKKDTHSNPLIEQILQQEDLTESSEEERKEGAGAGAGDEEMDNSGATAKVPQQIL